MSDAKHEKEPKSRPYAHLSVDELRQVENLADEEWFEELRSRGILVSAYDGPREPLRPIVHRPGALARFLKERG